MDITVLEDNTIAEALKQSLNESGIQERYNNLMVLFVE